MNRVAREFSELFLQERCEAVHAAIEAGRTALAPSPVGTVDCPHCQKPIKILTAPVDERK